MGLTSYPKVKEYLRAEDLKPGTQSLIKSFIAGVDGMIKIMTNRTVFEKDTKTEYHDGDGECPYFYTNEYPIITVISLHDDTAHPPTYEPSTLKGTDQYQWYSRGKVELYGGAFNKGLKNIKIVYQAGYEEIPKDLEYLATKWVVHAFRGKDHINIASLSGPDGGMTVFREFLDPTMIKILSKYRKPLGGN